MYLVGCMIFFRMNSAVMKETDRKARFSLWLSVVLTSYSKQHVTSNSMSKITARGGERSGLW